MTKVKGDWARHNMTLAERLELHSIPVPMCGCRLWLGKLNDDGYGKLNWEGRQQLTHRLSWTVANGPIPPGRKVLHRCDVRSCIEEAHLFLGTQGDNIADMDAKGRRVTARGAACHKTKLTEADVRAIRIDPRKQVEIARHYGVGKSAISFIKLGQTWRHLA